MINDYYPNHAVSKAKKNISNLRRCVTLGITRIPHGFKQSLADTLRHELEKHLRKKTQAAFYPSYKLLYKSYSD
jgi:hypothetical protein